MANYLKTKNKFFSSFTIKEFVALIVGSTLALLGLIFLILGLIDDYANIYGSVLTTPNTSMKSMMSGIGFTYFGLIVLSVGVIINAFSLSLATKGEDRIKEKENRRKQRLEYLKKDEQIETTLKSVPSEEKETN